MRIQGSCDEIQIRGQRGHSGVGLGQGCMNGQQNGSRTNSYGKWLFHQKKTYPVAEGGVKMKNQQDFLPGRQICCLRAGLSSAQDKPQNPARIPEPA